jgi:cytochrome c553
MITTQLRHFKLWHAGRVKNWGLANYELTQIRATFEDATRLFPNILAANMTTLKQPADEVGSAIEAKDGAKFATAFDKLTAACNSCHQADGFGFIAIREPRLSPIETSPFSNESFSPK